MSNAERASADSSSHEEEEIEYDSIDIEKASCKPFNPFPVFFTLTW